MKGKLAKKTTVTPTTDSAAKDKCHGQSLSGTAQPIKISRLLAGSPKIAERKKYRKKIEVERKADHQSGSTMIERMGPHM